MGAEQTYWHQMVTQSVPKPTRRFSKENKFSKIFKHEQTAYKQQFWGFWGTHGPDNMGLATAMWVLMGVRVFAL